MPAAQIPSANHEWAAQVQRNFIAYFRHFAGLPGITFSEGEVTWVASRGAPGSMVLSTQLADGEADQQIEETLRRIGRHTDEVDWFVFPGCRPTDLGPRLLKQDKAGGPDGKWMLYGDIGGPGGTWMVADLSVMPPCPPVPDGFHVKRGFGASDYSAFQAAYARHAFGPLAHAIHFIGYLGDEAVTSSTLLIAGGSASAYNVSTPTVQRRRGFGGAVSHAALQAAHNRGYRSTWIWSSPLGKSVYAGLGFVVTNFGIREYQ
jgi:hypothetical protein